ncbi:helix-turn-helix domain-containing protein [Dyadobacter sediminis]|uniref:AraC family transcriptional regulator n=1 Tax=Dyadobacter sediminis TaxID=1493691 RepID=A0A5R9KJB4_9BACT|nr:AraC family transcriptional regulator [Dyadobacter sediminis]TLU96310.1 AraC family transcriptional regulator [Dyadobacter sediminis]GGB81164.1 AraC family transcriptional regulator [Dyadobacter sediminis]
MIPSESIEHFYQTHPAAKGSAGPNNVTGDEGHFNVFSRVFCSKYTSYSRRDFYKISLIIGKGRLSYGNHQIEINQNALVFFNRNVPYSWQAVSEEQTGYFCLFTDSFLNTIHRSKTVSDCPILRSDSIPVYFVTQEQQDYLLGIFRKMYEDNESSYIHKYDLMRNYVNVIAHEAMKMQPSELNNAYVNGSERLSSLFYELLERQFPIESPEHKLKLKTAKDYAAKLGVHVNHLNRTLKEISGKTTTEHIIERILAQSKIMLRHSNWSIAEIAFCLGFEYPAYFNNLFKKQIGVTPKSYRIHER